MKEKCYVFAPYICVEHTEESSKQYDEFMYEYHEQHECCPGWFLQYGMAYFDNPNDYEDPDDGEGWKHDNTGLL